MPKPTLQSRLLPYPRSHEKCVSQGTGSVAPVGGDTRLPEEQDDLCSGLGWQHAFALGSTWRRN